MSRPIMFRAWDTIHNRMSNIFMLMSCIEDKQVFMLPENFEFMQFTGLKDKNGVEIFEGDICKAWEGVNGTYDYRILPIEFGSASFYGNLANFEHYPINSGWEVVGNAYEHPTLLTGGGR